MFEIKNTNTNPKIVIAVCIISFDLQKLSTAPNMVRRLIRDIMVVVVKSIASIRLKRSKNPTLNVLIRISFRVELIKQKRTDLCRSVRIKIKLILSAPYDHMLSRLSTAYTFIRNIVLNKRNATRLNTAGGVL